MSSTLIELVGGRLTACWWPAVGFAVSLQRADGFERQPLELLLWLPFCVVGVVIGRTTEATASA